MVFARSTGGRRSWRVPGSRRGMIPLAFEVWRLKFGVWPAAGAMTVENAHRRCAGLNAKHQTSNFKRQITHLSRRD